MSRIGLWQTSARAIWMRCFMPPDSSPGNLFSCPREADHGRGTRAPSRWRSAAGTPCDAQSELDVLDRGEPWVERVVALEDHDRDPRRAPRSGAPSTSTEPCVGALEAGEEVERRRLAAPRRPEHQVKLALGDREIEIQEHPRMLGGFAEAKADAIETDHAATIPCFAAPGKGRTAAALRATRRPPLT